MTTRVLVTGAAGFIGGHLCRLMKSMGYWVRAVDYVLPRYGDVQCNQQRWECDLRQMDEAERATHNIDWVFHCAADMGGAIHVFSGDYDREIIRNNTLIDINVAEAGHRNGVKRLLFTSSACVYPQGMQDSLEPVWLSEQDVYPAYPDSIYGFTKLHSEHLFLSYGEATNMEVRIARLHNIYGPFGAWKGNRTKAPAAMCYKIARAHITGAKEIEMFGDGEQVRSFCSIADAREMMYLLIQSDFKEPLNIGTDEAVSINKLAQTVMDTADYQVNIRHIDGPLGVRYRNADLTLMRKVLDYSPEIKLEWGIPITYAWIFNQVYEELMEYKWLASSS